MGIASVVTRKLTGFDAQIDNANRGYVGIFMAEEDPKDAEGKLLGAKVIRLEEKGAGKKAGLLVGDIISAVDGFKPGMSAPQWHLRIPGRAIRSRCRSSAKARRRHTS